MNVIELERRKPSADDPQKQEYAGQRTAQEVFEELKHRLEGMGYLPDEYFDIRSEWENGKEIPKDADLFCTVDYHRLSSQIQISLLSMILLLLHNGPRLRRGGFIVTLGLRPRQMLSIQFHTESVHLLLQ